MDRVKPPKARQDGSMSRPAHHRHPHAHPDVDQRIDAILDVLRADGGRVTTGRRAIVRALLTGPDHHVTADDVALMVQAEQPDVHLSTVYRTLEALEGHGIVDRVNLGAGRAVYHLTDHVHHHLVCDVCGSVTEIPHEQLAGLSRDLDERYGFELSARHLSIAGRCAACRAAETT
jgi:Fur family transcriptional regulator, ferric uptake regulator